MRELWVFECSGEPGLVLSILLNLRTMRLVLLVPILQGLEYTVKREEDKKSDSQRFRGARDT